MDKALRYIVIVTVGAVIMHYYLKYKNNHAIAVNQEKGKQRESVKGRG